MSGVGIVGAGAMGSGFARRLLECGHRVCVWNRTRAALEPLVALGATAAGSPAEVAAGSDFVITIVRDAVALAAVSEGAQGIAAGAHPGLIAMEMSTVGPDAIRALRATLPASTALLDAPVHVPREVMFEVLAKTPLAAQAQRRRSMVESGDYSASFRLSLARKAQRLLTQSRREVGGRAASGRLRAFRDRHRRQDLPARVPGHHVPPYRRPRLDRVGIDHARACDRRAHVELS